MQIRFTIGKIINRRWKKNISDTMQIAGSLTGVSS
jgi:hypothetical protein